MNDKFSIRQLAFSLVPVHSEDEAAKLIKKAAQDNKMDDMQILELIRQVNVANQYHAFKKANFQVNGPGLDTITLDPAKIFDKLAKVAAFSSSRKAADQTFTSLRAKSASLKKTAALSLPEMETSDIEKYAFLKALVKQAMQEDKEDALEAVHVLQRKVSEELRQVKQAFISESAHFDRLVAPFTALRQKYATLIDPKIIDVSVNRIPTAKDIVQIKASMEKISELAEACSHLGIMNEILVRR